MLAMKLNTCGTLEIVVYKFLAVGAMERKGRKEPFVVILGPV